MMSKHIIISSDSTCDLSRELVDRYQIRIQPMGVSLGDKIYRDGVDIGPDQIYAHHGKTGELPKTSAINVDEATKYFEQLTGDGSPDVQEPHKHGIKGAADVAVDQAEDNTHDHAGEGTGEAQQQRVSAAVHQTDQNVAAIAVGTQRMLGTGGHELIGQDHLVELIRGEIGAHQTNQQNYHQQNQADNGTLVVQKTLANLA